MLGKMKEVSKTDGRTALFVSHNVNAIESLSHRCILLESGRIVAAGCATGTVAFYLDAMASKAEPRLRFSRDASPDKIAAIEWVELSGRDQSSNRNGIFDFSDQLRLEIQYRLLSEVVGFHCAIELYAGTQVVFMDQMNPALEFEINLRGDYSAVISYAPHRRGLMTALLTTQADCYLEIGVFQGLTLLSNPAANPSVPCCGIDNFSQFDTAGDNLSLLLERRRQLNAENAELIVADFERASSRCSREAGRKTGGNVFC